MPALVHNSFRISNAKQFKESFQELAEFGIRKFVSDSLFAANTSNPDQYDLKNPVASAADLGLDDIPSNALDDQMYLFIGRVTPWTSTDTKDGSVDPNISETSPPSPWDSVKHGNFDHWDDMIAAKKVGGKDVSHVIKRERASKVAQGKRGWESGLSYHEYDDREEALFEDDMMHHTVNNMFSVFKCIKKGLGSFRKPASLSSGGQGNWVWDHVSYNEPDKILLTDGIDCDFMTEGNDGHQWKFMYTITAGEALKFVTTSYIPVRTVRKSNGDRPAETSDQYVVEGLAAGGAILNVIVEKIPVLDTGSVVVGYEPVNKGATSGGSGQAYVQTRAVSPRIDLSYQSMTFSFTPAGLAGCQFPGTSGGATGANNRFDFSDTTSTDATRLLLENNGLFNFVGYGVVIDGGTTGFVVGTDTFADAHKYVYPVSAHSWDGTEVTLTIDLDFVVGLANANVIPNDIATNSGMTPISLSSATTFPIEVHPRIDIKSNFDSSTGTRMNGFADKVENSFQAYAVVEPYFNHASSPVQYHEKALGRIVDAKVLNGGAGHFRVDETYIAPDISVSGANTAGVHACVAPVGGHGFDPVAELGGYNVMINARFEGGEKDPATNMNTFSIRNEFRKIGILKNPMAFSANNLWQESSSHYSDRFTDLKGDQCYKLLIPAQAFDAANTGTPVEFESDMEVNFHANTGTINAALPLSYYDNTAPTASATVVGFDNSTRILRLIKPRGDFSKVFPTDPMNPTLANDDWLIESNNVHSVTTNLVQAQTGGGTYFRPAMKPGSGNILYLENRTTVSRSENQSEDLKVSIQF